jgi:5-methylcytosine-specific restriction enzyme A
MQRYHDPGAQVAAQQGLQRSPQWSNVEREHLRFEPTCMACGSTDNLQVHHVLPFHFCILLGRPELELDQRNLITLCEGTDNHHLLLGHLDDWPSYNQDVRSDVAGPFNGMTGDSIRANPAWQAKERQRPPVWEQMSDNEKAAFRLLMDTLYPPEVATVSTQVTTPEGTIVSTQVTAPQGATVSTQVTTPEGTTVSTQATTSGGTETE